MDVRTRHVFPGLDFKGLVDRLLRNTKELVLEVKK
jgi:hypothetical protein